MTVVTQSVTHKAHSAGVVGFAVQACIGIGAGLMGVLAAALVLEAGLVTAIVAAVLAHKACVASPGLDQCALHAEVFARKPIVLVGNGLYFVEEFDNCVMLN